jgi:TonB family protein
MHPILLYLLKMLLCSGILYGYYRVALYNERFHQWNRSYLLAAMLLSLALPLVEIPILAKTQPIPVVYVLDVLPWNNAIQADQAATPFSLLSPEVLMGILLSSISLVLLVKLCIGIYKIFRHYRQAYKTNLDDVKVIFTQEPSAPYSFFHWLFWRTDVDIHSSSGKRMLQHELTHIRQKHSLDKLIMELILIFCWINPFFWLIRKELYMIHEFLADQIAIEKNNGPAFAEMILQSMHIHHTPALANPFFTSQIKRRLFMITSSNTNKYSYIKRILTLGIAGCTVVLVACTTEKTEDVSNHTSLKVVEGFEMVEGFNRFSVKDFSNPDLPEGTLIVLDGKVISLAELKKIHPDLINYDVKLTKEDAIKKYGNNAASGAYELYSFPTTADAGQPGKEHLPTFPGGHDGWRQYLQLNLRYPDNAIDKGTMGVVKIACTIMPDGTVVEAVIVENPGDGLGEEALRIITQGPKWVNKELGAQRVLIPVTFRLE